MTPETKLARERGGTGDAYFARRRIGKELDVLDALPQFVECRKTATDEGAPVSRRFDSLRAAVEQRNANCMLKLGNRLRHDRHRDGKLAGRLGHAAGLHDGLEYVEIPQLDAAADPVCPLHVGLLPKRVTGVRKVEIS